MIISVDIFYDEEKLFSILSNLQTNLFDIDLQTSGWSVHLHFFNYFWTLESGRELKYFILENNDPLILCSE